MWAANAKAGKGEYRRRGSGRKRRLVLAVSSAIAVVTNIEADHLENYDGEFDNLKKAYVQFLSQVKADGKADHLR